MNTVTQPSTRTCTLLHRQSHGPGRPASEPDVGKVRSGQAGGRFAIGELSAPTPGCERFVNHELAFRPSVTSSLGWLVRTRCRLDREARGNGATTSFIGTVVYLYVARCTHARRPGVRLCVLRGHAEVCGVAVRKPPRSAELLPVHIPYNPTNASGAMSCGLCGVVLR